MASLKKIVCGSPGPLWLSLDASRYERPNLCNNVYNDAIPFPTVSHITHNEQIRKNHRFSTETPFHLSETRAGGCRFFAPDVFKFWPQRYRGPPFLLKSQFHLSETHFPLNEPRSPLNGLNAVSGRGQAAQPHPPSTPLP